MVCDLVVSTSPGDVSFLLGKVNERIQSDLRIPVGGSPTAVRVADLDRDGVPELITIEDRAVSVYSSTPPWELRLTYATGVPATRLEVTDLNGDGIADVILLLPSADRVAVARGTGDATLLGALTTFVVGRAPVDLDVADLDGDNRPDLVTVNRLDEDVSFLKGRGDGSFAADVRLPTGAGSTTYGSYHRATSVLVADITGDDRPEIIVGHANVAIEWVEFDDARQPNCTTTVPFDCALALNQRIPTDMIAVDLDGNGLRDLVFASATSNDLVVLPNRPTPDGSRFGRALVLPLTGTPSAVAAADVTRDHRLDLVVSIGSSNSIDLFASRGNGLFEPLRNVPTGDNPRAILVADLDGNGSSEVLTANETDGAISVLDFRVAALNDEGTRLVDVPLPPCPYDERQRQGVFAGTSAGGEVTFDLGQGNRCRIDRLELEFTDVALGPEAVVTLTATDLGLPPIDLGAPTGRTWSPERVTGLARFEGTPQRGRWTLRLAGVPTALTPILHVNRFPADPLDGALPCSANTAAAGRPCTLDGPTPQRAFAPTQPWDLVLPGELSGGYIASQTLLIELTGPPDLDPRLVAFGARLPLARAERSPQGVWSLSWVVTSRYAGRTLARHLDAPTAGTWSVTRISVDGR